MKREDCRSYRPHVPTALPAGVRTRAANAISQENWSGAAKPQEGVTRNALFGPWPPPGAGGYGAPLGRGRQLVR